MTIFDRFRRAQPAPVAPSHLVRRALLPQINQRVTVMRAGHPPVPSRVEDESAGLVVLAAPNVALEGGEHIVITWEGDDGWYSLESTVGEVIDDLHVPMVSVIPDGRISHHDDRRGDERWPVELPVSLRPVIARVAKQGVTLNTTTTEISTTAVRFSTSAPFAPGDLIELRIQLGPDDEVSARVKVIRVDSVADSWRQVCTAAFDEVLRSDKSRLMAFVEASAANGASTFSMDPGDSMASGQLNNVEPLQSDWNPPSDG